MKERKLFSGKLLLSFIIITISAAIAAMSLELILIPNLMIDGGINGISIIINKLIGGSLGLTIIILNIPFLLIGYTFIGNKFIFKTGYAMTVFSFFLEIFSHYEPFIDDTLLATVYGGIALGVGVGLIIKEGGCLDGTEIVATLISKKKSITVGTVVFIFNIFIYGCATFVYGPKRALYSLLTYFVTYKVIDFVSDGFNSAKAVFIVTDNGKLISKEILNKLGRTVTLISGRGIISHNDKEVLYTVITRFELSMLKDILDESDTSSFVSVMDVSEIIGSHIKKIPN